MGICREKRYQKDEVVDSGDDVIVILKEILAKSFKIHAYNIKCQYSELKQLKANLKEDEVILSVDFSQKKVFISGVMVALPSSVCMVKW